MPRLRVAALSLACLAAVVGCQARGPAATLPGTQASAGLTFTGRLDVRAGGYRLKTLDAFGDYRSDGTRSLHPYEADQVASYVAFLYREAEASGTFAGEPVASTVIAPVGNLAFSLANLRPDAYYRVVIEARNAAQELINATATSKVEFNTVASGPLGVYESANQFASIPVTLLDQPFSGSLDVVREISPAHHGMRVELFEADAAGAASGDALASADLVGTGLGVVTFDALDYHKSYLVETRLATGTTPHDLEASSLATAVIDVDDYASTSERLATLTLPL